MLTLDGTDGSLRALLLENIHPDAATRLGKDGYQVETAARALAEDELIAAIGDVHLLGIRSGTHVTERVLDAAPGLLAIGAFCIGTNQIDLAAASRHGVAVFNAPFSNTRSVVELALAEIIALTRRLTDKNAQMHAGVWDKSAAGSARGARPAARHRRLRQHRRPALRARRGPRHDRVLLRHRRQARPRQRPALRHPRRAARAVRRGHPARRRPAGQQRPVRRAASSPRCGRAACSSTCPAASWSTTPRCAATSRPGIWPARPSTCSRRSRAAAARSSPPSCAACPTSSSPRTSAARPRRRSRTSASSSPAKLRDYVARAPPR